MVGRGLTALIDADILSTHCRSAGRFDCCPSVEDHDVLHTVLRAKKGRFLFRGERSCINRVIAPRVQPDEVKRSVIVLNDDLFRWEKHDLFLNIVLPQILPIYDTVQNRRFSSSVKMAQGIHA
jgi:hypothetical protein